MILFIRSLGTWFNARSSELAGLTASRPLINYVAPVEIYRRSVIDGRAQQVISGMVHAHRCGQVQLPCFQRFEACGVTARSTTSCKTVVDGRNLSACEPHVDSGAGSRHWLKGLEIRLWPAMKALQPQPVGRTRRLELGTAQSGEIR
jgi:hypothetical protein